MGSILGMLVKSANSGKVASKDRGFLDIYLESLSKEDPRLARTNFLLSDKISAIRTAALSGVVIAYGEDENLREIQKRLPAGIPFIAYGHRASFGLYTRETLRPSLAKKAAKDASSVDQRGCLSPVTLFVEKKGKESAMRFTERLAEELKKHSSGDEKFLDLRSAAEHRRLRQRYLLKKVKGTPGRSFEAGRWTVVYDESIRLEASSGQTLFVKGFDDLRKVYSALATMRTYLQSAALEAPLLRRAEIAMTLAGLGINRVCRAGRMQCPPATWHHDGRTNFASWLRWTDLE